MDREDQEPSLEQLMESAAHSYERRRREELAEIESRLAEVFAPASDRLANDAPLRAGFDRLVMSPSTGRPDVAALEAEHERAFHQALREAGVETGDVMKVVLQVVGQPEGSAFKGVLFALNLGLRANPDPSRFNERSA